MSSQAAIRQVREKREADVYKGDKRPVTLVGVNFRTAKRNIDEPLFAKLLTHLTFRGDMVYTASR